MTNSKGQSTNALYGFIRSLLKLRNDFEVHNLIAVFDGPHNAKSREAIYADYKAHRSQMPPDLHYQIEWARHWCDLAGIPSLSIPEVEADDVMGTVSVWASQNDFEIYLATSDKDMCQLVKPGIFILNTFKENLILNEAGVEEQFGVRPDQMVDFLSITGDASDNVPGISGFGPKTAADLLKQFGSLDEILANPEKVSGKKKQETLVAEKDRALLSRELVKINLNVKIPHDPLFYQLNEGKPEDLNAFYHEMNFSSLLKEMQTKAPETPVSYHLVNDENAFEALLERLRISDWIAIDTETDSEYPFDANLVGISFAFQENEAYYVPVNGDLKNVLEKLKPILEDPTKKFFGHNIKYDLHIFQNNDIDITNVAFDTMLASYILHAHERRHNLDLLVLNLFDKTKIPIDSLIGKGKNQISMAQVPLDKISEYACEDADYTFRLKNVFEKNLKERGLEDLYFKVELPLIKVLLRMERKGMWIDRPFLKDLADHIQKDLEGLTQDIYSLAGENFNINSPKQLSQILYEKLCIKPPRKTKSGLSTDAEVLEELKWANPICAKVIDYRILEKLRGTYVEKLPTQVSLKDGRIHCTFNQTVAATGRLSSQDPNLQNIPVRTPLGKKIREAFKPELPNCCYLSADYSQIELRLLAHLSEDEILLEAFRNNEDIHTHTAAQIYGLDTKDVSPELRQSAKAVNFGIIYGQGDFGLAQQLGISRLEASEIIQKYFKRYTRVYEYLKEQKELAHKTGRAKTLTGRERLLPEIDSKNIQIRLAAERLAVNTPLQGTQADLIKMAMIQIDKAILEKNLKGFMVLQIHDELLFEIPEDEISQFQELVPHYMQNIFQLKVPLVVDIHVGKNWKEC
jgi:DNA polymerase-1